MNSWKVLGQGPEQDLVLAVDFSSTGRPIAGFNDLVPRLDPPVTAWETLPPPAGHVDRDGYVDWWLAEVRRSGRPVRAVLGYCAGAVFAAQMAERIADWQEEPLLVLLDPERPNTLGLYRDFHTVGETMASMLSEDELRRYHESASAVREKFGDDDLTAVGTALGEVFTDVMGTVAERLELDDEVREELTGVFGSLVEYLVAADRFDPAEVWARSTAIRSGGPGGGAAVGHEITVDVEHHDLLRHDPTARAVSELLAARTSAH